MKNLCVLRILMWFSNWMVTSSEIPISIQAEISLKIEEDNLDLSKSNIWLQMGLQLQSGDLRISVKKDEVLKQFQLQLNAIETPTTCKGDFSHVGDHCYHFSTTKAAFNNASIACHRLGATLAHPMNSQENSQLTQYIRENKKTAKGWWIGVTDGYNEGRWVWAHDKSPVGYTDWLREQPKDTCENKHCAQYRRKSDYKWNDVLCKNKYHYICQHVERNDYSRIIANGDGKIEEMNPSTTTITAAPIHASKSDFIQLGEHSYYFSTTTATWNQAHKACQSINTQLAHPSTSLENSKLTQYIRENKTTAIWWIGATDGDKEGRWVWAHDKSPVRYTDWSSGEPNNQYDNEDCVHLRREVNYEWNDAPCNNKHHYICQSKDSKADGHQSQLGAEGKHRIDLKFVCGTQVIMADTWDSNLQFLLKCKPK